MTVTLIGACGSLDRANTVRATVDRGGTETSSGSSSSNWLNDARPPAG